MKKCFALTIVLLLLFGLTIATQDNASAGSTKRVPQAPLVLLETSEAAINRGSSARAIALSATDARVVYVGDHIAEEVVVNETLRKSPERLRSFVPPETVESITVGSEGNLYIPDSGSNQVRVMSPAGESLGIVPVARPYALGVLGNGNLVVASTAGMDLLHVYGPKGSNLGSFGEMRSFDNKNYRQNLFLNRGKIAIGPSDTIYYVSRFAPTPTVQKYSSDGQLLSEFAINGDAVDFQLDIANDFLRGKEPSAVGGFDVITSATVDRSTGHLWIGMNGTSKTGIVYEYDTNGVKLREYAFVLKGHGAYTGIVTGVKDLVVRNNWIYLLTWEGGIYRFSISNTVSGLPKGAKNPTVGGWLSSRLGSFFASASVSAPSPLAAMQLPCGTAQPLICTANCRSGASPTTKDCAAELISHKGLDEIVLGGTCSNSPGPEPTCSATANFCNTTTGVRVTLSTTLVCTAPPSGGGGGEEECPQGCPEDYVCVEGLCSSCSPILVDVSGSGFSLSNVDDGITFDFNGDKRQERISWTSVNSDNAWLVLDRNGNGLIDDGTELFGNITPQPVSANPNGFIALAEFDKPGNGGNGDGRVDRRDAIFSSLKLWQDTNHNGVSEARELHPPPSLGIKAFDLDFRVSRRIDQYGNQFRYRARVYDKRGASAGRVAWDVYLRKGN